jgi:hypothetical protein
MRKLTSLVALLCIGGAALAADGTLAEARRCAEMQDSLQRLVCYDRLFAGEPLAAAPAAPAASSADFGSETLKRSVEEREAEAGPRSVTATVKSLSQTRPNVFRVTLDNGQVWQQMDKDSMFHVAVGDTVEINRGSMGGYTMSRTSNGGSGWVKVNRLK